MTPNRDAQPLRLGTRGSPLARAQAVIAESALHRAGVRSTHSVVIHTQGDRQPHTAVEELSGQGWFTAELQRALQDDEIDLAVHSAKDLATERPGGLAVAAVLPRGDPRDAFIARDGAAPESLPAGARVGTSSRRRGAFLHVLYPHLEPVPIRGNVDTRLRKLDAGEVDALLLASAGLDRLGLGERAAVRLDPDRFVPAPAQGAIAIEVRAGSAAEALVKAVDHPPTAAAVAAERAVLAALGGGCLLPLGAWAQIESGRLVLRAALARDDGSVSRAEVDGDPAIPEEAGRRAAAALTIEVRSDIGILPWPG